MDAATSTAGRSVNPARVCLWLAAGLSILSQCLPLAEGNRQFGWFFREWPQAFYKAWTSSTRGSAEWMVDLSIITISFLIFSLIAGIILGGPWIMGFLRRARPILWIIRCLMLGLVGLMAVILYFVMEYIQIGAHLGATPAPPAPLSGTWVCLCALTVNTLGLWMIPRAVKSQALMAQEIPTTDEHG